METRTEQATYGMRCDHGAPLGTPGGYDLTCHLCESGLTHWYADPMYAMQMGLPDENMPWWPELPNMSIATTAMWRASDLTGPNACMTMRRKLQKWDDLLGEGNVEYQVVKIDEGYWGQPT